MKKMKIIRKIANATLQNKKFILKQDRVTILPFKISGDCIEKVFLLQSCDLFNGRVFDIVYSKFIDISLEILIMVNIFSIESYVFFALKRG